ncbi:MAG: hypothetical protein ABIN80_30475 [Dyadobacter sp.]|uniref:hypothetical protein n=1 Tax=Dyadobacter sp. TaxID=1914288 RepID=UPI003265868C
MKEISQRQFDAFCYTRLALTRQVSQEVRWFEAGNRKLLATIFFDYSDEDYGFVILGRDQLNLFRSIEVSTGFYDSIDKAICGLRERMDFYSRDSNEYYEQGDEKGKPNDIFLPKRDGHKLHPYFKRLTELPQYEAARNLIKEIAYSFKDVDGNYIEQFQTTAFDARLWELYLYAFFQNNWFQIDRNKSVPDFCLVKDGQECFVEAVTVGANEKFDLPNPKSAQDVVEYSKDYMAIKFGSALFTKLNHKNKYWELPHVMGKPLVFAIHDYHQPPDADTPASMTWSRAALSNYLYGMRDVVEFNEDGRPQSAMMETPEGKKQKIVSQEEHRFGGKVIPSNFFIQPETENISAILFSNAATIPTFNRMGKLAGLGSESVIMIRQGVKMTESGNILPFTIDVASEDYEESWGDSIVMYHNPNAKIPLNPFLFEDITHVFYDPSAEQFHYLQNPNEIYSSTTTIFTSPAN